MTKLNPRLASALPYLTRGGRVADVGTDHAYLPIYLVENGVSSFAVASDLREGPMKRAKENVKEAGLEKKIELVLCDGLSKIELYRPDDILIFGMGGELIVSILEKAPWVKNEKIGLILQPMSHPELLRAYLLEEKFAIAGESLSFDDRIYQTIYARYGAKEEPVPYTEAELLIGRQNLSCNSPYLCPLLERNIAILEKILDGKKQSAEEKIEFENNLLQQLKTELERINEHS